jgi:hypothetical protein
MELQTNSYFCFGSWRRSNNLPPKFRYFSKNNNFFSFVFQALSLAFGGKKMKGLVDEEEAKADIDNIEWLNEKALAFVR